MKVKVYLKETSRPLDGKSQGVVPQTTYQLGDLVAYEEKPWVVLGSCEFLGSTQYAIMDIENYCQYVREDYLCLALEHSFEQYSLSKIERISVTYYKRLLEVIGMMVFLVILSAALYFFAGIFNVFLQNIWNLFPAYIILSFFPLWVGMRHVAKTARKKENTADENMISYIKWKAKRVDMDGYLIECQMWAKAFDVKTSREKSND